MMAAAAVRPARTPDVPELHHEICCDENWALCGEDVSAHRWVDPATEITCPLCATATYCFICKERL